MFYRICCVPSVGSCSVALEINLINRPALPRPTDASPRPADGSPGVWFRTVGPMPSFVLSTLLSGSYFTTKTRVLSEVKHMKTPCAVILMLFASFATPALAQTKSSANDRSSFPYSNRFTLGGGVSQLLLGGFNVQAEYTTKRLVFDYSHGFNIRLAGASASPIAQDQKLAETLVSTLGIGVGYRITPEWDVRVEPKLHYYNLNYDTAAESAGSLVTSYKTVTLGIGTYYRYYPFRRQTNALAGVLIMPSVRFWPNVWSSLPDNTFTYQNKITNRTETYRAASQGFPGTGGLLANITVGYTFGMHRNTGQKK
ncbi:hypothetical protein [Spirosoma montaniterrae]|uniref:Outer membrane protein beta-barrel domain-containing protein n=1 Tax=Spirosoma montaniterrae TaxID=1178516 RepID=A0A1P9WZC4_9BACT|nr:hypothetical protein [Spirosoma montaniterrae]AQG80704.1 hypothetical protein AWR27_16055 [Spirosoma montaniterrae]